jgi:hypothetical protein
MPFSALALHRYTARIALSCAHVFAWVFVFQYFYVFSESVSFALAGLALTYALSQITVALLTPWAAGRTRHGLRTSMVYGTIALAAAFASLGVAFLGSLGDVGLGVALFAILLGAYRALYFVPYSTAYLSRGSLSMEVIVGIAPLFGGLLLAWTLSPETLLFVAALIALASLTPLAFVGEAFERFAWGYRETFHQLFAAPHRAIALRSYLDGAESAVLLVVWPIVAFLLIGWSYPVLGAILAATHLAVIGVRSLFGSALDRATPAVRATLAISAWTMRLLVINPLTIILVDVYHRGTLSGREDVSREAVADNNTYLDEYTALKEVSLALGRVTLAAVVVIASLAFAFSPAIVVVFALAALASALSYWLGSRSSGRQV